MESEQFDRITKRLHTGITRRRVSGVLGGLLALTLPRGGWATEAQPPAGEQQSKRKKRRNTCRKPRTRCGKQCVNLATDKTHCGRCGKRCRSGETCRGRVCCPAERRCGAVCCGDGEACQDGTCQFVPQAIGCTAEDSICIETGGANIHNCNQDTSLCAALNDGAPVCTSASACVTCSNARDCIAHFESAGDLGADRALCIDSCPHCDAVFGVKTVCIIPAIPLPV